MKKGKNQEGEYEAYIKIRRKGQPYPAAPSGDRLLQALLVGLDHLLDHLAADGAGLTGGQVAVVAVLEVDANLPWCSRYILNDPVN